MQPVLIAARVTVQTWATIAGWLDGLLRGRDRSDSLVEPPRMAALLPIIIVCGCGYGAVMGSFGGRPLQMLYSASKVPLLFGVTFVVALPAFFVLNTLAGLRNDFTEILRAVAATQAGVCVILMSLAPYTVLWYASSSDYRSAVVFNTIVFGTSSLAGQLLLVRFYRPLIRRNPRHRVMMLTWLVIFAFVGIQTGWMLKPFIGSPNRPPEFLRASDWTNAYVVVFRLFSRVLLGA